MDFRQDDNQARFGGKCSIVEGADDDVDQRPPDKTSTEEHS
jgi:hypothetical protein